MGSALPPEVSGQNSRGHGVEIAFKPVAHIFRESFGVADILAFVSRPQVRGIF